MDEKEEHDYYFGNLPKAASEDELRRFLEEYGDITRFEFRLAKCTYCPTKIAYIVFSKAIDRDVLEELNKKTFQEKRLFVCSTKMEKFFTPLLSIVVRYLNEHISEEDLYKHFSTIGAVECVQKPAHNYAYVSFMDNSSVRSAFEMKKSLKGIEPYIVAVRRKISMFLEHRKPMPYASLKEKCDKLELIYNPAAENENTNLTNDEIYEKCSEYGLVEYIQRTDAVNYNTIVRLDSEKAARKVTYIKTIAGEDVVIRFYTSKMYMAPTFASRVVEKSVPPKRSRKESMLLHISDIEERRLLTMLPTIDNAGYINPNPQFYRNEVQVWNHAPRQGLVEFRDFLKKYGTVINLRELKEHSTSPIGVTYLSFETKLEARRVCKLNHSFMCSRRLLILMADQCIRHDPKLCVKVSNLTEEITDEDVHDRFSMIGDVRLMQAVEAEMIKSKNFTTLSMGDQFNLVRGIINQCMSYSVFLSMTGDEKIRHLISGSSDFRQIGTFTLFTYPEQLKMLSTIENYYRSTCPPGSLPAPASDEPSRTPDINNMVVLTQDSKDAITHRTNAESNPTALANSMDLDDDDIPPAPSPPPISFRSRSNSPIAGNVAKGKTASRKRSSKNSTPAQGPKAKLAKKTNEETWVDKPYVYVSNLPKSFSQQFVHSMFSKYGTIQHISEPQSGDPHSTTYVLKFETMHQARMAQDLNLMMVQGKLIRVEICKRPHKSRPGRTITVVCTGIYSEVAIFETFKSCGKISFIRTIEKPEGEVCQIDFEDKESATAALKITYLHNGNRCKATPHELSSPH
uniref:RRM domain-containing protein n=1 Tax=Anopheles farauti TaxID=69004 RepID=A0A182Q5H6_9DIPT